MTAKALVAKAEEMGLWFEPRDGVLVLHGPEEARVAFAAAYGAEVRARKEEILAVLRREREARMEFALAYEAKLAAEAEEDTAPYWLAYATWCLMADALNGFVRRGLGGVWGAVREAVAEGQAKELRVKALAGWAWAHRERERLRYQMRWGEPEWEGEVKRLGEEAELWAWRAWLVELALKNPEASTQEELDPWVDVSPWVRLLARNGRAWGLVFKEEVAA